MKRILTLTTAGALLLGGCATTQQQQAQTAPKKEVNKVAAGAAIGAVVGGAIGALTGPSGSNKGERALIGAAAGAVLGGAIGYILQQQAEALGRDLGVQPVDHTNPAVKPQAPVISDKRPKAVVKEPGRVKVVLKDSVLFGLNSAELKPEAVKELQRIAQTLKENPKTTVVVVGYTDNTGSLKYNLKLSKERAEAVKKVLVEAGVRPERILVFGCGPKNPIAPNDTPQHRALNRRVEILIYPEGEAIPNPCG
ncbi:OmpA family protein [Thermovibrio ammonificans]|jgi:outer membrane protein OmpA-like peptidoglycan-associated protein|uniref:OmpA/MotB domain protein n=1 Tax=Thermovibrio ammonificans (strain DSM 15698 / JCM 12110 / HB-1) TaxID=648996 RepID=E8T536_THEA1|nr:OmpA family protein [Thermovibrio ammonificans]ADU97568.1 OmpA/MotB domain protein [Thermovibrio ammonificans HB-1]